MANTSGFKRMQVRRKKQKNFVITLSSGRTVVFTWANRLKLLRGGIQNEAKRTTKTN